MTALSNMQREQWEMQLAVQELGEKLKMARQENVALTTNCERLRAYEEFAWSSRHSYVTSCTVPSYETP